MSIVKTALGIASGLLFGAGLAVSGMTDPNKVLNFLDVTRGWDPSLALVMASAIPVSAVAFALARLRRGPLLEAGFSWPTRVAIDPALLGGSALFGLGWGLGGYCPGPALASLGHPSLGLLGFLAAMVIGLHMSDWIAGAG